MLRLTFVALSFLMVGCAARVVPVGDSFTTPDGHGGFVTTHNPDLKQPQDDPKTGDILGAVAGLLPGPWGLAATALVSLGAGVITQQKKSEGTIKRIAEGVHAFVESAPVDSSPLVAALDKSMDSHDKAIMKRLKPTSKVTV